MGKKKELIGITFVLDPNDFNNLKAIDFAFFGGEAIRLVRGIEGQNIDLIRDEHEKVVKVKVRVRKSVEEEIVAFFKSFGWKTKDDERQEKLEKGVEDEENYFCAP
jgi:protein gp37